MAFICNLIELNKIGLEHFRWIGFTAPFLNLPAHGLHVDRRRPAVEAVHILKEVCAETIRAFPLGKRETRDHQ